MQVVTNESKTIQNSEFYACFFIEDFGIFGDLYLNDICRDENIIINLM